MNFPAELKYTESHEWIRIDGKIATIGITDYAQGELGDVVFIDIPELKGVKKGEAFGTIEAVKTVSDIYAPVTGKIVERNGALEGSPELVNSDCYGQGWMVRIEMGDASEAGALLDAAGYTALIGK